MQKRSYDDILALLEDAYDSLIAPKYIVRKSTNKLHLIFMAFAKGLEVLFNLVYAVKYRFDPMYSEDDDLLSVSSIVGEGPFPGTHSCLEMTATNTSATLSKTLGVGTYKYTSSSGEVFLFTLDALVTIAPLSAVVVMSISEHVGSYPVTSNAQIEVERADAVAIDSAFVFSCTANDTLLGYPAEDTISYRNRIITDTARQDDIAEIQEAIRRVPGVFECNCLFNPTTTDAVYDGITLGAKELLIIITGTVTSAVAEAVAARMCYKTHIVDADDYVTYLNPLYVGGGYKVYFMPHLFTEFSLHVDYSYDVKSMKQTQIESAITTALVPYVNPTKHYDTITEFDIYTLISSLGIASLVVRNVDLLVGGSAASYVSIPKTRLAKLTGTTFTPVTE
jgi:hypothetical protein